MRIDWLQDVSYLFRLKLPIYKIWCVRNTCISFTHMRKNSQWTIYRAGGIIETSAGLPRERERETEREGERERESLQVPLLLTSMMPMANIAEIKAFTAQRSITNLNWKAVFMTQNFYSMSEQYAFTNKHRILDRGVPGHWGRTCTSCRLCWSGPCWCLGLHQENTWHTLLKWAATCKWWQLIQANKNELLVRLSIFSFNGH